MQGIVSSSSGKEVNTSFSIRTLSQKERQERAWKALGMFWGISLLTIPLPPIHWVSVPGFFFWGIYSSIKKLREPEYFELFSFSCPECSGKVDVPPQPVSDPLEVICPHCRYGLKLRILSEAA